MGSKKGNVGIGQDPVAIIVTRSCAQAAYKLLPGFKVFPPELFQAVAVTLGLPASPKKKKKGGGGGK
jgi:hypothetical protein